MKTIDFTKLKGEEFILVFHKRLPGRGLLQCCTSTAIRYNGF